MPRSESGRRGGEASAISRVAQLRARARARAVAELEAADPDVREHLAGWLASGQLDRWLQRLERHSYRRGYCARDEQARRDRQARKVAA